MRAEAGRDDVPEAQIDSPIAIVLYRVVHEKRLSKPESWEIIRCI